jgi:hypothetical protein
MHTMALVDTRLQQRRFRGWRKALYLFYAGLYAFVLPLICWGAEATPGHPHARAHFVFVAPVLHEHDNLQALHSVKDWLARYGNTADCLLNGANATQSPAAPDMPVGRAVPSQLALVSVIPLAQVASMLPPDRDRGGFSVWLADSIRMPFHPRVPTPPPR